MIKRILAASAVVIGLVGCGGSSSGTGTAYVYGINAVPNVGTVSITANGALVLNGAAYAASSSAFVSVTAGSNAAIFLTNSSNSQLASGLYNFVSPNYYATYALGTSTNPYLFIYPTDVSTPAANTGRLIFVNASVLQPAVDVYITPSGQATGTAAISSMTPFTSGREVNGLAPGTYDVQFRAAGTATVIVDEPAVVIGTSPTTNEIQLVGIADTQTGAATAQAALPVIPLPVIATATAPKTMGHATVLGHPNMTSFPKGLNVR